MRYAIVIEKSATGYSAFAPDLPGCIATGASVKEVEVDVLTLKSTATPLTPLTQSIWVMKGI